MSDTSNQAPERLLDEAAKAGKDCFSSDQADTSVHPAPQEPESSSNQKKHNAPVFGYLAILFAVAFFMLLLAYFMQQRNTEVAMSGLRDSISQFQSLDELRDENEALRGTNQTLQEKLAALEAECADLRVGLEEAENAVHELRSNTGKDDLLVLEAAMREEQYADAAAVCLVIQTRDLPFYEGVTYAASVGAVRVDPMQRFQEVADQLVELGYLERDPDSGQLALTQLAPDNGAVDVDG